MALYVIESAFTVATFMSLAYIGASGVQYFLYGYILVDYIFSFRKEKRNKTNIILGAIVLGLIYLAMCYSGGLSTIEFVLYPRDLITNDGHYAPFVAGIIVGLVIAVAQIKSALGMVQPADVEIGERKKNAYKKVYIIMLACVVALSSMNIICYGVAKSRKTVDVNITCNYEEFNQKSVLSGRHGEKGLSNIFSDWSTNCFNLEGNYVAELYEVRNKEKERAKFNTVIEDFVPLNLPTKREYYFEVFPAYTIEVSGLGRGSAIVNVSGYYPIPYYFLGFGLIYKAKANADFSFKINNNYGYSVLLNGKLIKMDKDGVYTIENVTSDLEIVIK